MASSLEVADILRRHGPAYRPAHAGHLSLAELKVMSAIETCRTAALGGHVEACEDCGLTRIAYNSCRNRHCPKCQGAAARTWLAAREADLLPVGYFHVVFTVPAEVAAIAFHNKAAVYDLIFQAASQTMLTIAADRRHLGARIGITAVLHTWGSAMTHHPHIDMIVPGGGISLDGTQWVASKPAFLLPVRVLSKLFRRLLLTKMIELHKQDRLAFFGDLAALAERPAFRRLMTALRKKRWVVYAKPPFAGPQAVLAYLSCYTHRVAISNRPLRRQTQSEPARELSNLVLGVTSALAISLAETPVVEPLARRAEARRTGLVQWLPLSDRARDLLGVVLMDYTFYLWHVLTHRVPALWRFHLVHHVDLDLDASTALRFHAVDMVVSAPWRYAQVALIGLSPRGLRLWRAFFFLSILFHHSNLRIPERWERRLAWLLTTPRMHGIHHSAVRDQTDSNWSSGLSFWDRLHGTFRLDVDQASIDIGVPAYRTSQEAALGPALAMPFRRQRDAWRLPRGR